MRTETSLRGNIRRSAPSPLGAIDRIDVLFRATMAVCSRMMCGLRGATGPAGLTLTELIGHKGRAVYPACQTQRTVPRTRHHRIAELFTSLAPVRAIPAC